LQKIFVTRLSCVILFTISSAAIGGQPAAGPSTAGPTDPKAQKTYAEALETVKDKHRQLDAIDQFKKADKQDGRHCAICEQHLVALGLERGDYKLATEYAGEMLSNAQTPSATAAAHAYRGISEVREGMLEHKPALFTAANDDLQVALNASPHSGLVLFSDGLALANLSQDEAARARFQSYLALAKPDSIEGRRAARYVSEPGLARQRMAPPFEATTIDGKRISLDDFQGKVVLLDFWATWCGPCVEALPHVQHIAEKFAGQPLVVLSVSLDKDDAKWKSFVASHNMTWLQARDGGWDGAISEQFGVRAIPHTFTIDADGVLQDEHVGDAAIEGKLKKLIAQAQQGKPAAVPRTEEAKLPLQ
jgi:thiol-disulfide isomerase/thioredoxin